MFCSGVDNAYFTDIANNDHPTDLGTDTILLLMHNTQMYVTDNWSIGNPFLFRIPTPIRNTLIVQGVDYGGSTVFVISEHGFIYTGLMDFDTMVRRSTENGERTRENEQRRTEKGEFEHANIIYLLQLYGYVEFM